MMLMKIILLKVLIENREKITEMKKENKIKKKIKKDLIQAKICNLNTFKSNHSMKMFHFQIYFFYSLSFYDDDDLTCYKNIFYILFYMKKLYIFYFELKYKLEISRDSQMPLTHKISFSYKSSALQSLHF